MPFACLAALLLAADRLAADAAAGAGIAATQGEPWKRFYGSAIALHDPFGGAAIFSISFMGAVQNSQHAESLTSNINRIGFHALAMQTTTRLAVSTFKIMGSYYFHGLCGAVTLAQPSRAVTRIGSSTLDYGESAKNLSGKIIRMSLLTTARFAQSCMKCGRGDKRFIAAITSAPPNSASLFSAALTFNNGQHAKSLTDKISRWTTSKTPTRLRIAALQSRRRSQSSSLLWAIASTQPKPFSGFGLLFHTMQNCQASKLFTCYIQKISHSICIERLNSPCNSFLAGYVSCVMILT